MIDIFKHELSSLNAENDLSLKLLYSKFQDAFTNSLLEKDSTSFCYETPIKLADLEKNYLTYLDQERNLLIDIDPPTMLYEQLQKCLMSRVNRPVNKNSPQYKADK